MLKITKKCSDAATHFLLDGSRADHLIKYENVKLPAQLFD